MGPLFDVRTGEARGKVAGFGAVLLLIIGGHTILETARDALLLAGPGPRALGLVYIAIAVGTVPAAALVAIAGERLGQREALLVTLAIAIVAPALLFFVATSHLAAMATYVLSGIIGSIVVPQFWTLAGSALTVGEGRRLFGVISTAGVVGGILGPLLASASLVVLPVKGLLLVSSSVFAGGALAVSFLNAPERTQVPRVPHRAPLMDSLRAFRETPFLTRVALVVVLSTATFLALDYLFKSTLAREIPRADLAGFIAHYYLALNVLSLVVQLLTSTVVRRLGVLPALVPMPLLLLGSALATVFGGALPGALVVKGVDGSMRYSIHRVTSELMYLPVPPSVRQRTKPLIDGGLVRLTQMVTGFGLLAVGGTVLAHPRALGALVAALAAAWLLTVLSMRRPYLQLLRGALTSGSLDAVHNSDPLDLETARVLVQRLVSEDPSEVESAMMALQQRGRAGFVPALVLLHHEERVLVRALEIFGESPRADWFALARVLLEDPREAVRVAAARALARHEQLDATSLANDAGWRARGYVAVRLALRDPSTEVVRHPSVASLLGLTGIAGEMAALGLTASIADAPPTPRLSPLLASLANEPRGSRERTELIARAIAQQRDRSLVPHLVSLLSARDGREVVRAALVTFGESALEQVLYTLRDPTCDRRLRLHVPKTIARFATARAAECLLREIETERDGMVRYKAIRALRTLVMDHRLSVNRRRIERLCCLDLERHFARLAMRISLDIPSTPAEAERTLLMDLLSEKAAHALERAFILLQIARPRQGVHHAYIACRSDDAYARATGSELVDALLRHRDEQRLRRLFRLATDDLPLEDRVDRARAELPRLPRTRDERVAALQGGDDPITAALCRRLEARREARYRADAAAPTRAL